MQIVYNFAIFNMDEDTFPKTVKHLTVDTLNTLLPTGDKKNSQNGIGINPSDNLLVTKNGGVLMSSVPFSREWSFLKL